VRPFPHDRTSCRRRLVHGNPLDLGRPESPEVPRLVQFDGACSTAGEFEVSCEPTSIDENTAICLWLPDEIGKEIQLSCRMLVSSIRSRLEVAPERREVA
jgi:hypothetical protein